MAVELKDTLNLPRTDFPMRAALPAREPERFRRWEDDDLYGACRRRSAGAEAFVLHDGPPFTNGDVHIGTALNKILKDITCRYRRLEGQDAPFVPGWDCHGLPIEQMVARRLAEEGRSVTPSELRRLCAEFSTGWIARQEAQFRRLGILADWRDAYRTMDPAYEASILRTFAAFVERGVVYRRKKPVYWSIPFETALAEAEIEYRDHVSPSIWVRFPIDPASAAAHGLPADAPCSVLIWTTTPWTLPANLAIAVHPEVDYAVADFGSAGRVLAAVPLLGAVAQRARCEPRVLATSSGAALEGLVTQHPFLDRVSPIVTAVYVTTESGTGCVHTAPGHGLEDYQTGLKYGLEIYCPVGDDGCFVDDGRIPARLVGLSTLETKGASPANDGVLELLRERGALFAEEPFAHSYPHCWRSKTPIVFRAVDQWFVALDEAGLRQRALAAVAKVAWIPPSGENRIRGAIESRPDWCISRQRTWGVPLPAFFGPDRKGYLDARVIRAIADRIEHHPQGANLWFELSAQELLHGIPLPEGWPAAAELVPGKDTLDVWIDSGSSHAAVLTRPGTTGLRWPADLYLEGSDQHRGWFQSSLWTSVVTHEAAPFRAVLTHGFIVDEERRKISKSSTYEKPQTAEVYANEYGADIVRLWVASLNFRDDIPVSREILARVGESYRTVRNTLRFQLGVLHDFDPGRDAVPVPELDVLDRWALDATARLSRTVRAAYRSFEYHRVYQDVVQFCATTLSARYHDILKDRLYTLGRTHRLRRSSQTAIRAILERLLKLLAPVLVFTADEAWAWLTAGCDYTRNSVHLQTLADEESLWEDPAARADIETILALRELAYERIEALRREGAIGRSLDAAVTLALAPDHPASGAASRWRDRLAELLIVSRVDVRSVPSGIPSSVSAAPALGVRCPRCWRVVDSLVETPLGRLCPRCAEALLL